LTHTEIELQQDALCSVLLPFLFSVLPADSLNALKALEATTVAPSCDTYCSTEPYHLLSCQFGDNLSRYLQSASYIIFAGSFEVLFRDIVNPGRFLRLRILATE
jgi:hypothetical protein